MLLTQHWLDRLQASSYRLTGSRRAVVEGLTRGDTLAQAMLRPQPIAHGCLAGRYMQAGEYVLLGRLAGFLARSSETPLITPDYPERYHPIAAQVRWDPSA